MGMFFVRVLNFIGDAVVAATLVLVGWFVQQWHQLPGADRILDLSATVSEQSADLPAHIPGAFLAAENSTYLSAGYQPLTCLWDFLVLNADFPPQICRNMEPVLLARHLLENSQKHRRIRQNFDRILMTLKIGQVLSRAEIFEIYLDRMYFGRGAFGIHDAAGVYFRKAPGNLTIAEASLLSGLIKSPNTYSPYEYPEEAKRRRNTVIGSMADRRMISAEVAAIAKAQPLNVVNRAGP